MINQEEYTRRPTGYIGHATVVCITGEYSDKSPALFLVPLEDLDSFVALADAVSVWVVCAYSSGLSNEPVVASHYVLGQCGYLRRVWEELDAKHRPYFVRLLEEEAREVASQGHGHGGWSNRHQEAQAIIAAYHSGDKCQAQPIGELHFSDALDVMSKT